MKIERPKSTQKSPENAEKVFKGKIFDIYQWEQSMYDGSTKTFEKLKRPDTVVVFPVLNDGTILLTEQEQPGKDPFIGACGGRMEEGEDVLESAKREFLEETGYEATEYILWKAMHPASKIDWVVYFFIAKGCKKVKEQELDGGEKISLTPVTFDEFLQIGRNEKFMEREIVPDLYEALLDPEKYKALKELFSPLNI
jgi:8-oxo-dGTP pyrophosphatase MutT (NUDIX family)